MFEPGSLETPVINLSDDPIADELLDELLDDLASN